MTKKGTRFRLNTPKDKKIYQISKKYTKWQQNLPDFDKIHQMSLKYQNSRKYLNTIKYTKTGIKYTKKVTKYYKLSISRPSTIKKMGFLV
jgi:hypothetical protein